MSVASKSRFIFLIASSLLALIAVAIISSCLFSVSFRYITDHEHLKGTRYYGLIRYCFESELGSYGSDDSNADVCYLRTAAPKYATKIEYKTQYGEFELATLILLSCAIASSLLAICFAICTIFTPFGALAHSVMLLVATICSISAFIVYTYFNELKDNQNETVNGNIIRVSKQANQKPKQASLGLFPNDFCQFSSVLYILHNPDQRLFQSIDSAMVGLARPLSQLNWAASRLCPAGLRYHFGWAYYWSGGAAACLFVSFVCSLFASACVLVHKQQKDKIDTVVL
ncbi:hypothetical protein ANCCEY_13186 [Ancylostoma ceylanicum]|uniref:Clc-like protein n=1 Tax=Ancylostoma ceylanicum TaxID=53326 RepID=A0A0D6LCZ8_9BILA|nr:hypothetical protein ANCCEY_13186 [Ancylostoma ceylanicum]